MNCNLCPNKCNVDRDKVLGSCGISNTLKIAKYAPFFYEEPCISGTNGSGAIFFCGCSLKCSFCQNFEVSRNKIGRKISDERLISIMEELKNKNVHNINLVNPTHYSLKLKNVFEKYSPKLPIVYNTHGYENTEIVNVINDFADVYLVDLKYFSSERSYRYSGKNDYFKNASQAIKLMLKSKPLIVENGIMRQGVIVRHLILPQNTDESIKILDWYKNNIGDNAYLSVMTQYTPFGEIQNFPELKRKLTPREIKKVYSYLFSLNLSNVFLQEKESAEKKYIPEWDF